MYQNRTGAVTAGTTENEKSDLSSRSLSALAQLFKRRNAADADEMLPVAPHRGNSLYARHTVRRNPLLLRSMFAPAPTTHFSLPSYCAERVRRAKP